jgi:hypothetical protein
LIFCRRNGLRNFHYAVPDKLTKCLDHTPVTNKKSPIAVNGRPEINDLLFYIATYRAFAGEWERRAVKPKTAMILVGK